MKLACDWAVKQLGYRFSDPGLLERALTHKSKSGVNNERLEYLGDAVLGLVIAEALYQKKPDANEGDLSRLRSLLVRRETLADVASAFGLGDQLQLGGGESRSGGHQRRSIMADALEAIYGAIYIDGGYSAARQAILEHYAVRLSDLPAAESLKDPKTQLQEALQSISVAVPEYGVVAEDGPAHNRSFVVRCQVKSLGIDVSGRGSSRRKAEQEAASAALDLLARSEQHAS